MEIIRGFKPFLAFSLALALLCLLFTSHQVESSAVHGKAGLLGRHVRSGKGSYCATNQICGWGVYSAATRVIQHYVTSSCHCITDETCVRAGEDATVPAHVYRCQPAGQRRYKIQRPIHASNKR